MSIKVPAVIEDAARNGILNQIGDEQGTNSLFIKGQCLRMLDWLVGRVEYADETVLVDTDIRVGHARIVCQQLRRSHANLPIDQSVEMRRAAIMKAVNYARDDQMVLSAVIITQLASSSMK